RRASLPDIHSAFEEYVVEREPFYLPVGDEVRLFEAAYAQRIPVLLKGPTGCGKTRFHDIDSMKRVLPQPVGPLRSTGMRCGKTRFIESMSWKLGRGAN